MAEIKSNVKLIRSGNAPTTSSLSKGQLAFGRVGGVDSLYGNDGSGIIKVEMGAGGIPIIYFKDEDYLNAYVKAGNCPTGEWYAAIANYQEIVAEKDTEKTTADTLYLKEVSNNSDFFIINNDEYVGAGGSSENYHENNNHGRDASGRLCAYETAFIRRAHDGLRFYVDTYPFGKIGIYADAIGPGADDSSFIKLVSSEGSGGAPHFEITVDIDNEDSEAAKVGISPSAIPSFEVRLNRGWINNNTQFLDDEYGANFFKKSSSVSNAAKKGVKQVSGLPIANSEIYWCYDTEDVLGTLTNDTEYVAEQLCYWNGAHGTVEYRGMAANDAYAHGDANEGDLPGLFFVVGQKKSSDGSSFGWTGLSVKVRIKWWRDKWA